MKVLVVDDEAAVRVALERALVSHGYDVVLAQDGFDGRKAVVAERPDIILLDLTMPKVDGLRMCRQLRESGDRTPVIVLTARARVDDRVEGLDAGADDYLGKPFALKELLARMRALVRRASDESTARMELSYADIRLDLTSNTVHRGDTQIPLSRTESRLLELSMRNPDRALTKQRISEDVWGYDFGATSNPHEVYVGYLRRKLEADGAPRILQTVRGVGYMLHEQ